MDADPWPGRLVPVLAQARRVAAIVLGAARTKGNGDGGITSRRSYDLQALKATKVAVYCRLAAKNSDVGL